MFYRHSKTDDVATDDDPEVKETCKRCLLVYGLICCDSKHTDDCLEFYKLLHKDRCHVFTAIILVLIIMIFSILLTVFQSMNNSASRFAPYSSLPGHQQFWLSGESSPFVSISFGYSEIVIQQQPTPTSGVSEMTIAKNDLEDSSFRSLLECPSSTGCPLNSITTVNDFINKTKLGIRINNFLKTLPGLSSAESSSSSFSEETIDFYQKVYFEMFHPLICDPVQFDSFSEITDRISSLLWALFAVEIVFLLQVISWAIVYGVNTQGCSDMYNSTTLAKKKILEKELSPNRFFLAVSWVVVIATVSLGTISLVNAQKLVDFSITGKFTSTESSSVSSCGSNLFPLESYKFEIPNVCLAHLRSSSSLSSSCSSSSSSSSTLTGQMNFNREGNAESTAWSRTSVAKTGVFVCFMVTLSAQVFWAVFISYRSRGMRDAYSCRDGDETCYFCCSSKKYADDDDPGGDEKKRGTDDIKIIAGLKLGETRKERKNKFLMTEKRSILPPPRNSASPPVVAREHHTTRPHHRATTNVNDDDDTELLDSLLDYETNSNKLDHSIVILAGDKPFGEV